MSSLDVFDLLPDDLVLEIFNKLQDAKSLSICMSLCKRFVSLVPLTDNLRLTISSWNIPTDSGSHTNSMEGFFNRRIFKPIQSFLQRMVTNKSTTCSHCDNNDDTDDDGDFLFSLPNDMLKSFKQIRSLIVQLPTHDGDISPESGLSSGEMLKWTADFGKELESCVILGASGFRKSDSFNEGNQSSKNNEEDHDQNNGNLTNKQLKKRVAWTISCLIACSARHHMLKQIISSNRMIRDVEIRDASKQGMIQMKDRQVVELREEVDSTAVVERTKVPAVTIKMWYVPVLELPESGYVIKGATLAVIRPVVEEKRSSLAAAAAAAAGEGRDDGCLAVAAFGNVRGEKCFAEAVRKFVKKKAAYTIEEIM